MTLRRHRARMERESAGFDDGDRGGVGCMQLVRATAATETSAFSGSIGANPIADVSAFLTPPLH